MLSGYRGGLYQLLSSFLSASPVLGILGIELGKYPALPAGIPWVSLAGCPRGKTRCWRERRTMLLLPLAGFQPHSFASAAAMCSHSQARLPCLSSEPAAFVPRHQHVGQHPHSEAALLDLLTPSFFSIFFLPF